ncbi:hypothetical protein ACLMJK_004270 [Lecanora helva]
MKFLCLHGTDTNAEFLQMQLCTPTTIPPTHLTTPPHEISKHTNPPSLPPTAALTHELTQEKHTFHYLNGPLTSPTPYPGLESFPGPFHRYYDRQQLDMSNLPSSFTHPNSDIKTPADWMRLLRSHNLDHDRTTSALDFVLKHMESSPEGPYDGIIGFSEGALVAADVILHQQRHPPPATRLRVAIFISGAPAWDYDLHRSLLADETKQRIRVPSVSVIGKEDPIAGAARALYELCEEGKRGLVEWEGGHGIPRGEAQGRMVQGVRRAINRARMGG